MLIIKSKEAAFQPMQSVGDHGHAMGHASQPLRPNFSQAIASGLMPVPQPEQEVQKKKRGRPRKDATVDGSVPLSPDVQGQKRGRGRPPGSGKKQKEAMAAVGEGGLGKFLQTLCLFACLQRFLPFVNFLHC